MSTSSTEPPSLVPEWGSPTSDQFQEVIIPRGRPTVLRGIAAGWPLVASARRGREHCIASLAVKAVNRPARVLLAQPEEEGRFHYRPDGQSLNFVRAEAPLPAFLVALHEHGTRTPPHALVTQGLLAERYLPGFRRAHPMPLAPDSAEPRLWIGNAAKVATHNDPVDNIAIVAAGRRRFTLFPPDAEPDLYMGPVQPSPAGTPISMVHVTAPDLDRYPRFASALRRAEQAELSPGDGIYIPRNWFHHVEALDPFNVLVNYWWAPERTGS